MTPDNELMLPVEVAKLFRVKTKTVARWEDSDKLTAVRTLGGHRRYRREEVMALLEKEIPDADREGA